ncbi:sentrin-specific protease 1-like [Centruroides sculpturatus]|uniref:sentrin-specific protease 1-like n=2 Tax=Centruroides sculpturatus TaxID=218467 RepID=UPI000C6EE469|nr:sentrin-specific protease 1-like [Centruroides sculpturatus]
MNDASTKYKRIRYSGLNGRTKFLTAQESIRLHEKEQYKLLLQQHTSESLFNSSKVINNMKDAQVQSDLSYGKPQQKANKQMSFKFSSPVRREKLSKESTYDLIELLHSIHNVQHSSVKKTSTSKEYLPILKFGNDTSTLNKYSLMKANREKPSPIKNDDDDSVIITKVEVIKPPLSKIQFPARQKENHFFNGNWLKELRQSIERRDEEEKKKIRYQEELTRSIREKREAKYAIAEEKMKEIFKRKGTAVLEEKPLEDEDQLDGFPELTSEMDVEVDDALRPNPPDEVLAEGFRLSVARRDMETLAGLNWLNDEIINFYMNLLMERSKLDNFPTVYAFNTFFYTKLLNSGHSALKRWTRKVDIFEYDMLLIPVHMGMHWCLAVIDFRHKKIQYYDSMGGQNDECLNALRTYLQDERMDKKKEEFDMSGWALETVKNIPHQMNGSDCGMFALKYAEYITRDAKINFTQGHMPYFRRRMVYEILKKQLL